VQVHHHQSSEHCKQQVQLHGLTVCIRWTAVALDAAVVPAQQSCGLTGRGGLVPLKMVPT